MKFFNKISDAIFLKAREAKIFYAIFYLMGVLGFLSPETKTLFIKLVPFALMLGFAGVLLFHKEKWDFKTIGVFFTVYSIGFIIECIGTNTGLIFGEYKYGNSLGIMIFETPLIIGMNWLFLVYVSSSIVNKYTSIIYLKLLLPPIMLVGYDLVMEEVASDLEMWSWKNNEIPIQNYVAWFFLALIFNFAVQKFRINTKNKLALTLFSMQFLFFLILWVLK